MSHATPAQAAQPHGHALGLQALHELSLVISAAVELQPTLERVCEIAARGFGVDHVALLRFDGDRGAGALAADFPPRCARGQAAPLHDLSLTARLRHERQPIVVDDLAGICEDALGEAGLGSLTVVPIISGGEVIGALRLGWTDRAGVLDAERMQLCKTFAAMLGAALHREQLATHGSLLTLQQKTTDHLQRLLTTSTTLRDVSEAIQRTKTFRDLVHVLLTGVTANFGLRFNRAALLLYDNHSGLLQCEMAIGHFSQQAAEADWEANPDDGPGAVQRYFGLVERGETLPPAAFDERARTLRLPMKDAPAFAEALSGGQILTLDEAAIAQLPATFRDRFQPAAPLVVAPLIARKWPSSQWPIGILVADNKFTNQSLEPTTYDALTSLSNTAALAIDNYKLFERSERARAQMQSLFDASSALLASPEPRRVLEDIVFRVKHFVDAMWVSCILIDRPNKMPHIIDLVSTRQGHNFDGDHTVRPNGVSMRVMRDGKIAHFNNTAEHRAVLNPFVFAEGAGAVFCFPLKLHERPIGVMWIHCRNPRRLSRSEETAIQLYANQAIIAFHSVQQRENLEAMHRASEEIGNAVQWDAVAESICQHACRVLRARCAVLWPYDEQHDEFLPDRAKSAQIALQIWKRLRATPPVPGGRLYHVLDKQWDAMESMDGAGRYLDRGLLRQLELLNAESWQAISLRIGADRLGVLWVGYNQPRRFSSADTQRAQTFAHFAAQAYKKAMLLEQVKKTNGIARLIAQMSVMEQLDRTLAETARVIGQYFQAAVVTIYAYDADKEHLSAAPVQVGLRVAPPEPWSQRLPISPIVAATLQSEKVEQYITDQHPLFAGSRFCRDEGTRCCVAARLRSGGRTVGAIFLNYRAPHQLGDDELSVFRLVADQLAVAVRNEQLRQQSEQRAATLSALHTAAQALLLLPSREQALKAIVRSAVELIHERDGDNYWSVLSLHTDGRLLSVAASDEEIQQQLQARFPHGVDLAASPIGIVGRAFRERRTLNIFDVRRHPDYIEALTSVTAQLAVPIATEHEVLGVLSIEHSGTRAFTEDAEEALETLARYAAIVIGTAERGERPQSEARGPWETAQTVSLPQAAWNEFRRIGHDTSMAASLHSVLRMACGQIEDQMNVAASIRLYDEQNDVLEFNPRWSPSFDRADADRPVGRTVQPLDQGICGWVARHRIPYRADDVTSARRRGVRAEQPAFIELNPKPFAVRSELAVPIMYGKNKLVGVLDVQSEQKGRFSDSDVALLELAADQLAVSLEMARQYERLGDKMRALLTWKSNLTASSAWWHSITKFATLIADEVNYLRAAPPKLPLAQDAQNLAQVLERIEHHANSIRTQRVPAQLGAREQIEPVQLNHLVQARVQQLRSYRMYEGVQFELDLHPDYAATTVDASAEWLRHALDLLIDNAAKFSAGRPAPRITLRTRIVDNDVHVLVQDTGIGISDELRRRLFSEQTDSHSGQGLGLLIVAVIAKTYHGLVDVEETSPAGTTIRLEFPAAR